MACVPPSPTDRRRGRHPRRLRRHRLADAHHIDPNAPRARRTAASSGVGGFAHVAGSSRPPRRSTSCSARARSSATSCARTGPPTGSPTSRRPTGTRACTLGTTCARCTPTTPSRCRRSSRRTDRRARGRTRSTTWSASGTGAAAASSRWATPCTPPARAPGRVRRSPWRTRSPSRSPARRARRSPPRSRPTRRHGSHAPSAVVKYARAINAQKRVTTSRLGIAIRDAMMPMFLRKAADDTRNDWLYNHTVDWDRVAARHAGHAPVPRALVTPPRRSPA